MVICAQTLIAVVKDAYKQAEYFRILDSGTLVVPGEAEDGSDDEEMFMVCIILGLKPGFPEFPAALLSALTMDDGSGTITVAEVLSAERWEAMIAAEAEEEEEEEEPDSLDDVLKQAVAGITTLVYDAEDEEADSLRQMAIAGGLKVSRLPPYGPEPPFSRRDVLPHLPLSGTHAALGKKLPLSIDYPVFPGSKDYLGREVRVMHANYAADIFKRVFVKPAFIPEAFTGRIMVPSSDMFNISDSTQVWVCDLVDFRVEYRAFILGDMVLGQARYWVDDKGKADKKHRYDPTVADRFAKDYAAATKIGAATPPAPAAFLADFGLTADGRTLLIAVNDAHSFGLYGVDPRVALAVSATRWKEMWDCDTCLGSCNVS